MTTDRLSAADWTAAGLRQLATAGYAALKADPVAKVLKVSRGSFYWHFADVAAFHAAVLERWRAQAYANIVTEVESAGDDILHALLDRAFRANTSVERAVRAWATSDPAANAAVDDVDARRLAYLENVLSARGLAPQDAATRARLIHWAYMGYMMSGDRVAADVRARLVKILGEI